jgi:hypothetical protein
VSYLRVIFNKTTNYKLLNYNKMKKLLIITLLVLPLAAISQTHHTKAAYKASYSSNWVMAGTSYSNKVLTAWKDFENNTFDKHADMYADTLTVMLADEKPLKGKAENLAGVKAFRSSITDYKVLVRAWISVKSVDKGDNLVCVWGDESYTDKDGKKVSHGLHEVWVFNKAGKISTIVQFARTGA